MSASLRVWVRCVVTAAALFMGIPAAANASPTKLYAWGLPADLAAPSPIPVQIFGTDIRQDRQVYPDYSLETWQTLQSQHPDFATFVSQNAGMRQLYIFGDEPDVNCVDPGQYAAWFHNFVQQVRALDPSARFSSAGFSFGDTCTPHQLHETDYADAFIASYQSQFGQAPPVAEWRFHDFLWANETSWAGWYDWYQRTATWCANHGTPFVLGSYGFPGEDQNVDVTGYEQRMLDLIKADSRVAAAVWWFRDPAYACPGSCHWLYDANGNLTAEGQVYVNNITVTSDPHMNIDVPSNNGTVSQNFLIAGWAFDSGAAMGTGVSTVHFWAWPTNGGSPIFLGHYEPAQTAQRPDVAAAFGLSPRFGYSGFGLIAPQIPSGTYYLVVYPYSVVMGGFFSQVITISVQ